MGSITSAAADQERDRWVASPRYAENRRMIDEHQKLMDVLNQREVGSLTLAELRFLLRQPLSPRPEQLGFDALDLKKLRKIESWGD